MWQIWTMACQKDHLISEVLTHRKTPATHLQGHGVCDPKHVPYKSKMRLSQQQIQMGMSSDKDFEKPESHL